MKPGAVQAEVRKFKLTLLARHRFTAMAAFYTSPCKTLFVPSSEVVLQKPGVLDLQTAFTGH
jgi:hypothetical protein